MRGIRVVWTVVLSLLILCACLGVRNVDGSPTPIMMVEPDYSSAEVGSTFTIDIIVEDVEECFYWQVHLNWSTAVLNLSSTVWEDPDYGYTICEPHITPGDFMADAPEGSTQTAYVNYDAGWCEFGETMFGTYPAGTGGNGWLGTVEFTVLTPGTGETTLDIEYGTTVTPYALTYMTNYYDEDLTINVVNGEFIKVISPMATDFNKDGRIDIRDLARVAIKYGWTGSVGGIPEDCWGPSEVPDGEVDIYDLSKVASQYGTEYYP